jgi:hypothetical protein
VGDAPPPQSTSVSLSFFTPSLPLGARHTPFVQTSLRQSLATTHPWPLGQAGAPSVVGEVEPPQSMPVSLSFFTPSVALGG